MSTKVTDSTGNAAAVKLAVELRGAISDILDSKATDCLKEKAIKSLCGSIMISAYIPEDRWKSLQRLA